MLRVGICLIVIPLLLLVCFDDRKSLGESPGQRKCCGESPGQERAGGRRACSAILTLHDRTLQA